MLQLDALFKDCQSPRAKLIQLVISGRGKVVKIKKTKEPQPKAAKQEKVSKAKAPEKKKPEPAPEKAAAKRKSAGAKKAPKKQAAAIGGNAQLEARLEDLKRENEALRAQLAAAIARADHLAEVTGSVAMQLDGVISVIRGLVDS